MILSFFKRLFGTATPEAMVELKTEGGKVLRIPWSDYEATLLRKVKNQPADAVVLRDVAQVFTDWRKFDKALHVLDQLIALRGAGEEDFVLRARCLTELGRGAEAEAWLQTQAAAMPRAIGVRVALAHMLNARRESAAAQRVVHEAVALDPDAAEPLRLLYAIEKSGGGAAAAERALRTVAQQHARAAAPFQVLGEYAEHESPERASTMFEEGLARNPRFEPLLTALAANLGARGLYDELIRRFDPMVSEGYVMDFSLYAIVAEAHFAKGNRGRVLALYNERMQRGPDLHKRMARQKLNEFKERVAAQGAPAGNDMPPLFGGH
jgi:tetratricopeptide (TPR) repeat protein